jgi:hypothetical protein
MKHINAGLPYVQVSFAMLKWMVYIVTAVRRNELYVSCKIQLGTLI